MATSLGYRPPGERGHDLEQGSLIQGKFLKEAGSWGLSASSIPSTWRRKAIRPERRSAWYITATSSWHPMTLMIFMTCYISSRAAITKHHRLGIWDNGNVFFSSSVRLEVWDQAVRRVDLSSWFIGDQLSPVSSHGLPRVCVLISFIRTTVTLN